MSLVISTAALMLSSLSFYGTYLYERHALQGRLLDVDLTKDANNGLTAHLTFAITNTGTRDAGVVEARPEIWVGTSPTFSQTNFLDPIVLKSQEIRIVTVRLPVGRIQTEAVMDSRPVTVVGLTFVALTSAGRRHYHQVHAVDVYPYDSGPTSPPTISPIAEQFELLDNVLESLTFNSAVYQGRRHQQLGFREYDRDSLHRIH